MIRNRDQLATNQEADHALKSLEAGIRAADPDTVVSERVTLDGQILGIEGDRWDLSEFKRIQVVGGGNAAGHVAAALESVLGAWIDGGDIVTDNPVPTERVTVHPGNHPLPSQRNVTATREVLSTVDGADADDLVFAVVSGGGSSLLAAPTSGITQSDLTDLTDALLTAGASIATVNTVRKQISEIKGGGLAERAAPATVVGLVFSDVVGNDLGTIASGPLTPDSSTPTDAVAILDRYGIDPPQPVHDLLQATKTSSAPPQEFEHVTQYVLADGDTAIDAAGDITNRHGYATLLLGSRIRGEATEVGAVLAGIAESSSAVGIPIEPPAAIVSGGESTVTVEGDGSGGPNQELVLSALLELGDSTTIVASVDTDGFDGGTDVAGAIGQSSVASPAPPARQALADNDAGGYLSERDAVIRTGPTTTNVNDLTVVLIPDSEQ